MTSSNNPFKLYYGISAKSNSIDLVPAHKHDSSIILLASHRSEISLSISTLKLSLFPPSPHNHILYRYVSKTSHSQERGYVKRRKTRRVPIDPEHIKIYVYYTSVFAVGTCPRLHKGAAAPEIDASECIVDGVFEGDMCVVFLKVGGMITRSRGV